MTCVVAVIVNSIRVFAIDAFITQNYQPIAICVVICAETRSLSFSGLFTITLLFLKYGYTLIMSPNQLVLVRTRLLWAVQRVAAPPMEKSHLPKYVYHVPADMLDDSVSMIHPAAQSQLVSALRTMTERTAGGPGGSSSSSSFSLPNTNPQQSISRTNLLGPLASFETDRRGSAEAEAEVLGGVSSLVDVWRPAVDFKGYQYFFNVRTLESVWTLPPGAMLDPNL